MPTFIQRSVTFTPTRRNWRATRTHFSKGHFHARETRTMPRHSENHSHGRRDPHGGVTSLPRHPLGIGTTPARHRPADAPRTPSLRVDGQWTGHERNRLE